MWKRKVTIQGGAGAVEPMKKWWCGCRMYTTLLFTSMQHIDPNETTRCAKAAPNLLPQEKLSIISVFASHFLAKSIRNHMKKGRSYNLPPICARNNMLYFLFFAHRDLKMYQEWSNVGSKYYYIHVWSF